MEELSKKDDETGQVVRVNRTAVGGRETISRGLLIRIPVSIGQREVIALWDSGSERTIISTGVLSKDDHDRIEPAAVTLI